MGSCSPAADRWDSAAVAGATRWLEAHGRGFDWGVPNVRIPIVVGAVIDDLSVGDGRIRPDADMAERACAAATTSPVAEGCVGAGAGATVGKMFRGHGLPGMKGGIGTASIRHGDLVVAALAVVNAAGDILDWRTGRIVAGALTADGTRLADSRAQVAAAFEAASRSAAVIDRRCGVPQHDARRRGHEHRRGQDEAHQAGDDGEHRCRRGRSRRTTPKAMAISCTRSRPIG